MLRTRQRFGKYVIERRIAEGGFAAVFQARDTIEGVRVALKIPYAHLMTADALDDFRHEVRLVARIDHPNILPLKYADFIDDRFVIVTALGEGTLDDKLRRRMPADLAVDFARQMLAAAAHAHEHRIIHCDIKPDNLLVFPNNHLRLADFGIARVAQKTLKGSGAGTVGYIAPEQAMGKPSLRSDVFSLGIVMYQMFTGQLPEWPYHWPLPGSERLRSRFHPDLVTLINKAMELDARKRYKDARQMYAAFLRIKSPIKPRTRGRLGGRKSSNSPALDWKAVREREFQREYGKLLATNQKCRHCHGAVSEAMQNCPWCGTVRRPKPADTSFPQHCPRCCRGMKLDWQYCPWCFGKGFEPASKRHFADRRYTARCGNSNCQRKLLMPFMKYCPWCNRRVQRKWAVPKSRDKCGRCGWGVLKLYWSYCAWCGKRMDTV
jgi:serine/threonine-protein kinase